MNWIKNGLNRKFIIGTAAGLLISSLVFLILFITLYQRELAEQRVELVTQVNHLLQTSLENAMLKRDLEGLQFIVDRLGAQPNISAVTITNPQGEIRFANHRKRIGGQIDPRLSNGPNASAQFIVDDTGSEVLRSTNPVANKAPCFECHGPLDKSPINGILYVDYDAGSIRHQARNTILFLMGAGALIVLINIFGGWWFIHRYVLAPVQKLSVASEALAVGSLDARVKLDSTDELAQFGDTFNRMAENLQVKIRELHEKEVFLQALVDAIPDGIRVIDSDFEIQLTNRTYFEQLGLTPEASTETRCYASSHNRDTPCPPTLVSCPVHELGKNPSTLKVVHRHVKADGANLNVEVFAAPMQVTQGAAKKTLVVESIRDLAQDVRFSHEQRLAELGRLAAGVAHEIHNPLTSVRLALHAALKSSEATRNSRQEIVDYLRLVDKEIDACINVTERLLKLSIAPGIHTEIVSVKPAIEETVSLLKWDAEESGIDIAVSVDPPNIRVLITDSELRMLTLNLAQNSFHAMPNGGSLNISAEPENGFVYIRFKDSGSGIPAGIVKHIFDPFFSRRADGSMGTGLGLPICKAITDKYEGSLEVETTDGQGTCFVVRLRDAESLKGE